MDISDTLAPDSTQLDGIDLLSGPRVFTVREVSRGNVEQPVQIALVEFPRPWKPGKNMRRVLAACWGTDASAWVGRRCKLYFDPEVTFGKDKPGGTRIEALSHIDQPRQVPLLASRGKSATYTVQPLTDDAPEQPPDPLSRLWAALRKAGVPNDQAKAFLESALGRDLASASDVKPEEAADVLDNFDALLASWMEES